uniref:Uncharacterized protein n=1 Tax=Arundo donax TaxID=35708 RepID=A0A0A9B139_ARUDO
MLTRVTSSCDLDHRQISPAPVASGHLVTCTGIPFALTWSTCRFYHSFVLLFSLHVYDVDHP